jgi:hypothetical protein
MTNLRSGIVARGCLLVRADPVLLGLVLLHSAIFCASLILVANRQFYILYSGNLLSYAVISVAAFSLLSLPFAVARFSFGYFVSFYFYTLVLGFLWLDVFTKYNYDRKQAALSAALSFLAFFGPALLIKSPIRQAFSLSRRGLERLLDLILVLSAATILAASIYNFRLVSLAHIYDFRDELKFPGIVRYSIGIMSTVLLPFAFACFCALQYRWKASVVVLLLLLFYPITLSKLAFFAPIWLIALLILSKIVETRTTVVLSLFLPMITGIAAYYMTFPVLGNLAHYYFNVVNIRMLAAPSSALDVYNEYFSYHPLTYFCQISFLKTVTHCPYQDPLSVVMDHTYGFGNLNASLFATEGVASVGLLFAPLAAFACGLVIALGNRLSAGLPSRFVLLSAALLPQVLTNVPLTTALLTHGMALLFLLWYITPRAVFHGGEKVEAQA